ncbi:MAG: hypothetical protein ACLRXQ_06270 [Phascolarctobacterium faecium]
MFDKLRLKLTIIYTGIFSLLVVMIVTGCIILLGHSMLTHEKQEMRELIIHEGEEFVASGELPVSKHSIEVGRELAYAAAGFGCAAARSGQRQSRWSTITGTAQ